MNVKFFVQESKNINASNMPQFQCEINRGSAYVVLSIHGSDGDVCTQNYTVKYTYVMGFKNGLRSNSSALGRLDCSTSKV